jgi:hypothetical protein
MERWRKRGTERDRETERQRGPRLVILGTKNLTYSDQLKVFRNDYNLTKSNTT